MTVIKKGDKYLDHLGNPCFISYIRLDVVKLTYPLDNGRIDVWKKDELIAEINRLAFVKQKNEPVKRENIGTHLVEYQLSLVGKTMEDARQDDKWYDNITMTSKQHEMFKSYAIPLKRKIFKCNKKRAETTFAWFDLAQGLRVKD